MWWPDLEELIFDSGWLLPLFVALAIGVGAAFLSIVLFGAPGSWH